MGKDNTNKEGICYTQFSGDSSDTYSSTNYETYALLLTPEERLIAAGEISYRLNYHWDPGGTWFQHE